MDINQIFEGLELSEDTVSKIATIYEAAVAQGIKEKTEEITASIVAEHEAKGAEHIAHLNEQYEAQGVKLVEQYEEKVSDLETQADAYLTEAVKTWISENKTEVVNMTRLQTVERFVSGMRELFSECQIDVPESEHSIAEEQAKTIASLQESQSVLTSRLKSLTEENNVIKREAIVKNLSEGLTVIQSEKLMSLAEEIKTESISEFSEKLNTLKEAFIKPEPTKVDEPNHVDNLNEDLNEKQTPAKKLSIQEQAALAMRQGLR